MRNIGKRLGAILLSALMILSLTGVQPQKVSTTAIGDVGKSITFSSGKSTDVTTYMGVHFILAPYKSEYYAWSKDDGRDVDIKTKTKGSVLMKADIKEKTKIGTLNFSKNSIYVGVSSDSKVAAPTSSVAGTTGGGNSSNSCVKSYGWGTLDNIIKKMSGNNKSVISAWEDVETSMKACNKSGDVSGQLKTASEKLQKAFNKLESRIQSSDGQANNQTWMKKAFNSYNARMDRKDDKDKKGNFIYDGGTLDGMYSCKDGYYLIIEPVVYIKRNGNYLVVSAQDLDGYMSRNSKSLLGGFMNVFTQDDDGITKGSFAAGKFDNLSSMLRQKDFKYTKSCKVKAKVKSGVDQNYGHNHYTYYSRGGYACIVPKSGPIDTKLYSVNQLSTYSGKVGSSSAVLKNSSGTINKGEDDKNYPSTSGIGDGFATITTGNYLVDFPDNSSTSVLNTAVDKISTNLNNSSVSINWASSDVSGGSLSVGKRWGINKYSTVKSSSSSEDYFVNANVNTGMSVNKLTNEKFTDNEAADAMDSYPDDNRNNDPNPNSDNLEDDDDAGEADDAAETDTDYNDLAEADLTKLTSYGYVSTAGDYNKVSKSVDKIKKVLADTHKNAINGYCDVVDPDKRNAENDKFINYVPYSSTVVVNKSSITSYGYNLLYTIGDNGNGSLSNSTASGRGTYETFATSGGGTGTNSENAGYFRGGKNTFFAVIIKNSVLSGANALNYVKSKLNTSSPEEFMNRIEALKSDANICKFGDLEGGDKVVVGAESTGSGLIGYTVVFIGIKGDIPLTGKEVLESYQLNNIDGDIASTFANQNNNPNLIFRSRKVSTYKYNGNHTTQSCSICGASWNVLSSATKSYNVNYKDNSSDSSNKYVIAYDDSNLGNYLIKTTLNGGNIDNRSTLKSSGENVNTSSTTKKFTYAFNLVRKLFEDKTASSLTANNGISSDVTGVLKMSYGNVPSNVTEIDKKRDANAFVGNTLTETLKWTGTYVDTTEYNANGKWRLADVDTFTHTCYTTAADGTLIQHDLTVSNRYTSSDWSEGIKPFKLNRVPMETAKIIVTEKAKKYQTDDIATGKNENPDGIITSVSGMKATDIDGFESVLDNDTRYAYLEKHDVTGDNIDIHFYPEVKMMMYGLANGHTSVSSSESIYKKALYTMGDKKRTAQSSSLYLYRISSKKTAEGVGQKLTGKVYSDDMTTNSAGTGNGNTPVIYAGGNVSLKVDGANMNLNLYGYSVDLVNKAKDGTGFKINATDTATYKSIVDDESDIYANWGNEQTPVDGTTIRTSDKLFNDYKNWVANMSDSNNYGADVTLKVTDTTKADGIKEYNNFSTTIGKIVTESGTKISDSSKEEGVYPIAVYNGKVVTARETAEEQALSRGYWNLIAQVQKDYNCDETTAIKVIEDSGMLNAIYNAIESSTSAFNKSGKAVSVSGEEATNQNTAMLGNGTNWYDEVVKTFCIRRYVTETLHFDGTVLSDKIDYDAAPKDNSVSNGLNDKQNSYNKANSKWYISYYFKNNPNSKIGELANPETKWMYHNVNTYVPVFYNPADANSSQAFINAKNSFTVLTEKLHIDGADFVIPSSATTDESN